MGTVTNPLGNLLEGIVQGHSLANQIKQQAMQQEAHSRAMAQQDRNSQIQEIQDRMMLEQNARPVNSGAVQDSFSGPASIDRQTTGIDGLPETSHDFNPLTGQNFIRPVDKSRKVTYKTRDGQSQDYELLTPDEQATKQAAQARQQADQARQSKVADITAEEGTRQNVIMQAQERAKSRARENQMKIEGGGIPAPEGLDAVGVPAGTLLTRAELAAAREEVAKAEGTKQTTRKTKLEADQLQQQIDSGVDPKATGDFEKSFLPKWLLKAGKTQNSATVDDLVKAHQDYAAATKDPATVSLAHELTQARLDQLRQQRNGGPSAPINPGSREFKVAQDLAYGRLTMPQFRSLYAYSRDTNKKLDIYDKASELNPAFNPAAFEMGFKFASNPKVQQQLSSLDNVMVAIPDMIKFSDEATRTGIPILNKFIAKGGLAIGQKKYSNFATARTAFADELSGALGFGSATDMSREMGFDMTKPDLSPENFASGLRDVVAPFIERKRGTMLHQMGVYGQEGMNPAASTGTGGGAADGGRGGGGRGGGQSSGISVKAPDGSVHTFPDQAKADQFKKLAGIN